MKWQYGLQSCSRYKKAYLMKKLIFSSKLISLFKRSQFCFVQQWMITPGSTGGNRKL